MRERAVRLPADVQETVRALHPELKRRVRVALDLLRTSPDSGKALRGELAGWRSLRIGRFRIIDRETPSRIDVAAVGPRASIYLETIRLLKREGSGQCSPRKRRRG